jgi:hypothetical protein
LEGVEVDCGQTEAVRKGFIGMASGCVIMAKISNQTNFSYYQSDQSGRPKPASINAIIRLA